jgi:uncharacterized membrane protein
VLWRNITKWQKEALLFPDLTYSSILVRRGHGIFGMDIESEKTALEILKKKYARSEITKEKFEKIE